MRFTGVFLAVAAAISAAPAYADYYGAPGSGSPLYASQSIIGGDVALALGWYDPDKGKKVGEGLANVRINFPVNELWNAQVELSGLATFKKDGWDGFAAFGHAYYKDPQFAAGAFVGGESVTGGSGVTVGAETALFMPTTTVVGNVSHTWADGFADFWTATGELRWYWNANTKLTGLIGYWNGDGDGWAFGAGVEHLIAGTNLSLFGNAYYYTNGGDAWEVIGGARYAFGRDGGTLQQHDWDRPFSAAAVLAY